jgi:pyruvate/2-oxoacid:ferredoxin oxidoreductase alpha subunit
MSNLLKREIINQPCIYLSRSHKTEAGILRGYGTSKWRVQRRADGKKRNIFLPKDEPMKVFTSDDGEVILVAQSVLEKTTIIKDSDPEEEQDQQQ